MAALLARAARSVQRRTRRALGDFRIERMNAQVADHASPALNQAPVVFFNASTRLQGMSLNAAYGLIASWAVCLAGAPVVHFACQGGLSRCVLGANRDHPQDLPPCAACIRQTKALLSQGDVRWFMYKEDAELASAVREMSVDELSRLVWQGCPLGALALPSMRWVLRRHHLLDDEPTRFLFRQYVLSAWRVRTEFEALIAQVNPQAVVVFNGMFFPEATARWTAQQHGIRAISHEVGLRPFTAFFTTGEATAYPIHIPYRFELDASQNARLDRYLSDRMQGNFSMAGVRFWPEMRRLDDAFLARAAAFKQIVPVFTNVIFDTSQPHSNVVFSDMFAWLEGVLCTARGHPETLFVIRAHPDESRSGKASRESVTEWVQRSRACDALNVLFIPPEEYISSYELIGRAKFVMVYNSTIGLEAAILGAPVLCAGRARYTQLPTVFFPQSVDAYWLQSEQFLDAETIEVPPEFQKNARRFLYYQLYRASLPFEDLIEADGLWNGYVRLKNVDYTAFDLRKSSLARILADGILRGKEFLVEEG